MWKNFVVLTVYTVISRICYCLPCKNRCTLQRSNIWKTNYKLFVTKSSTCFSVLYWALSYRGKGASHPTSPPAGVPRGRRPGRGSGPTPGAQHERRGRGGGWGCARRAREARGAPDSHEEVDGLWGILQMLQVWHKLWMVWFWKCFLIQRNSEATPYSLKIVFCFITFWKMLLTLFRFYD